MGSALVAVNKQREREVISEQGACRDGTMSSP